MAFNESNGCSAGHPCTCGQDHHGAKRHSSDDDGDVAVAAAAAAAAASTAAPTTSHISDTADGSPPAKQRKLDVEEQTPAIMEALFRARHPPSVDDRAHYPASVDAVATQLEESFVIDTGNVIDSDFKLAGKAVIDEGDSLAFWAANKTGKRLEVKVYTVTSKYGAPILVQVTYCDPSYPFTLGTWKVTADSSLYVHSDCDNRWCLAQYPALVVAANAILLRHALFIADKIKTCDVRMCNSRSTLPRDLRATLPLPHEFLPPAEFPTGRFGDAEHSMTNEELLKMYLTADRAEGGWRRKTSYGAQEKGDGGN
jgi:hypothetical protein